MKKLEVLADFLLDWPQLMPLFWRRAFVIALPVTGPIWLCSLVLSMIVAAVLILSELVLETWADDKW